MTDVRPPATEAGQSTDGSLTDVPSRGAPARSMQPTAPVSGGGDRIRLPWLYPIPRSRATRAVRAPIRACGWPSATVPLLLDVPQDIEGIDVGPSPTPYERAERLAAEAYGAERAWFLTNGATQGNHALCLAMAPPGVKVVLQRNSHASMIDGLILSGGVPSWVAPEYDPELGMAHGVTPESLAGALAATPEARSAFIVSPTYYGMAADVAGCAEVAHRRRGRACRGQRLGLALRFSPCATGLAAGAGRRRDARLHAQDRWQPDPVGDAPGRPHRPDRHRRGGAGGAPRPLDQPELAAHGLAGCRAPPAGRPWRVAARRHDRGGRAGAGGDRASSQDARSWELALWAAPGSRGGTHFGS